MPWKKEEEMNIWPDPAFEGWGEDTVIDATYPEWIEEEKIERTIAHDVFEEVLPSDSEN